MKINQPLRVEPMTLRIPAVKLIDDATGKQDEPKSFWDEQLVPGVDNKMLALGAGLLFLGTKL